MGWGGTCRVSGRPVLSHFCTKSDWNHEEQVLTYGWGWVAVRSFTRITDLRTMVSEPGCWTHCNKPPRMTPQAGTGLRPFLGTQQPGQLFLGGSDPDFALMSDLCLHLTSWPRPPRTKSRKSRVFLSLETSVLGTAQSCSGPWCLAGQSAVGSRCWSGRGCSG